MFLGPDGEPVRTGFPAVDVITSLLVANAAQAALRVRDRTGAAIDTAAGSGHIVYIPLPPGLDDGMLARFLGAEAC